MENDSPMSRPRTFPEQLVLAAATVLGLGHAPRAPGTWGTLAALPLWWLMAGLPLVVCVLATLAAVAVAVVVAGRAERIYGAHDVRHIVIDEVAGMLVAAVGVPFAWPQVISAFVLFRLFDVTKPGPVGLIDRRVGGGLGVVLDDVAAGLLAAAVLHGARLVLGGWW